MWLVWFGEISLASNHWLRVSCWLTAPCMLQSASCAFVAELFHFISLWGEVTSLLLSRPPNLHKPPCLISLRTGLKICHLADQLTSFLGHDPCVLDHLLLSLLAHWAVLGGGTAVAVLCTCLSPTCPTFPRTLWTHHPCILTAWLWRLSCASVLGLGFHIVNFSHSCARRSLKLQSSLWRYKERLVGTSLVSQTPYS